MIKNNILHSPVQVKGFLFYVNKAQTLKGSIFTLAKITLRYSRRKVQRQKKVNEIEKIRA